MTGIDILDTCVKDRSSNPVRDEVSYLLPSLLADSISSRMVVPSIFKKEDTLQNVDVSANAALWPKNQLSGRTRMLKSSV